MLEKKRKWVKLPFCETKNRKHWKKTLGSVWGPFSKLPLLANALSPSQLSFSLVEYRIKSKLFSHTSLI